MNWIQSAIVGFGVGMAFVLIRDIMMTYDLCSISRLLINE